mmetsp:Transcript_1226/g.2362  ORF Transcript_1226/g.2362 Transcript_1226/m.2362 type:complete len:102 (+) Transcript_1226:96-401(+)
MATADFQADIHELSPLIPFLMRSRDIYLTDVEEMNCDDDDDFFFNDSPTTSKEKARVEISTKPTLLWKAEYDHVTFRDVALGNRQKDTNQLQSGQRKHHYC